MKIYSCSTDVDGVLDFPISMIETEEEEACMEQALKSVSVDEEHKLCRFRVLYKFPILSLKKRGSRGIKKKTEEDV